MLQSRVYKRHLFAKNFEKTRLAEKAVKQRGAVKNKATTGVYKQLHESAFLAANVTENGTIPLRSRMPKMSLKNCKKLCKKKVQGFYLHNFYYFFDTIQSIKYI